GGRRAIEAAGLEAAHAHVAAKAAGSMVRVAGDGWHPGVIGIVASRLREHYERPACVVALDGDIGKGSGRSANGFDLGAAIIAARQAGLLVQGGRRSAARGLSRARRAA